MSKAVSVTMWFSVLRPTIREMKNEIPTAMMPRSHTAQKSAA